MDLTLGVVLQYTPVFLELLPSCSVTQPHHALAFVLFPSMHDDVAKVREDALLETWILLLDEKDTQWKLLHVLLALFGSPCLA